MSLRVEFYENTDKQKQWNGFIKKTKLAEPVPELKQCQGGQARANDNTGGSI